MLRLTKTTNFLAIFSLITILIPIKTVQAEFKQVDFTETVPFTLIVTGDMLSANYYNNPDDSNDNVNVDFPTQANDKVAAWRMTISGDINTALDVDTIDSHNGTVTSFAQNTPLRVNFETLEAEVQIPRDYSSSYYQGVLPPVNLERQVTMLTLADGIVSERASILSHRGQDLELGFSITNLSNDDASFSDKNIVQNVGLIENILNIFKARDLSGELAGYPEISSLQVNLKNEDIPIAVGSISTLPDLTVYENLAIWGRVLDVKVTTDLGVTTPVRVDFDRDGSVNEKDVLLFLENYQKGAEK